MSYPTTTKRDGLRIGSFNLSGRAVLAPMSGITDVPFRRIVLRFGAPMVVSEMVASDEFVKGSAEARMRAERPSHGLHVVQIAGCEAKWMALAAKLAVESGADIIDINMGCPAKRVTGGYAGSSLMRDLDHASRLIEATLGAVDVPVTLKMRLGWDDQSRNAPELAARAERLGISLVTVHARTRQQFYNGRADWNRVAEVRDAISIPLIVNGDVTDVPSACEALRRSGADAVMIGRAAVGKPWLVGEIADALNGTVRAVNSDDEMRDHIVSQYEEMLALMGVSQGLRHARKHLAAYADTAAEMGCLDAPDLRQELVTTNDPHRVVGILNQLFSISWRRAA